MGNKNTSLKKEKEDVTCAAENTHHVYVGMQEKRRRCQCMGITLGGYRCKKYVGPSKSTYCSQHGDQNV